MDSESLGTIKIKSSYSFKDEKSGLIIFVMLMRIYNCLMIHLKFFFTLFVLLLLDVLETPQLRNFRHENENIFSCSFKQENLKVTDLFLI